MTNWPLLSVIIFLPLIGSLIIVFIKEDSISSINIRWAALWTSIGTFVLSFLLWIQFDNNNSSYQFVEKINWFDDFNFYYHIGVDGISLFMILLSTFLTPLCILASWKSIQVRVKEYMLAFLFLILKLLVLVTVKLDSYLFKIGAHLNVPGFVRIFLLGT